MEFRKLYFRCFLSRNCYDKDLIVVGRPFHIFAPVFRIDRKPYEYFFELKTDHQVPIALYCENELKHYSRRNCGRELVLAYSLIHKRKLILSRTV